MLSFSSREKYKGYNDTSQTNLNKGTIMTETIVITESTEIEPTPGRFSKFIPTTKTLLIGAGVAAVTIAGAIWFAVKRQDEDDFEDELAKFDSEDAETEVPA